MTRFVVLLRAINVGARTAPMAELREACEAAGFADVKSYIASGNLVLSTATSGGAVEREVEAIIKARWGFHADAVARDADAWNAYLHARAFPEARKARPNMLHLCLAKAPPAAGAVAALEARATLGERFVVEGDALWVDFAGGVGRSKITPAVLDKAVGAPATARNWNTVVKLAELVAA